MVAHDVCALHATMSNHAPLVYAHICPSHFRFFFDRLVGMVLTHLVEAYVMRLLGTPSLKAATRKERYNGGFVGRFKLTEDRLKKVVADIIELCNCFGAFRGREDLTLVTQALNHAREMLTIDADNLPAVFEAAVKSNPLVSTHSKCVCDVRSGVHPHRSTNCATLRHQCSIPCI